MIDPTAHSHPRPRAFIFGPQDLSFDIGSFKNLHSQLWNHQWALDALASLPKLLDEFSASEPTVQQSNTRQPLEDLNAWIAGGAVPDEAFPLPNVVLCPIVVIGQLVEYMAFLAAAYPNIRERDDLPKSITEDTETFGLCTGTLSAFAVACSSNIADIQRYGAVAARLAMLVGAAVDTGEALSDPEEKSMSFSASWNAVESSDSVSKLLEAFPDVRPNSWYQHQRKG